MRTKLLVVSCLLFVGIGACTPPTAQERGKIIRIDGSSSVFPLTEAITEAYYEAESSHKVVVGVSGTGGGLRKLLRGEIDICNASRKMSATEKKQFAAAGVEILELPVAHDGIVVVVHPKNHWANNISIGELNRLWRTESQQEPTSWSDLRKSWPNRRIVLFGPGQSSGTYDFFTQVINGKARSGRGDYAFSENDNFLVNGVSGELNALGYLGFNYYIENAHKLKALAIIPPGMDSPGAVAPTDSNIANGTYQPLSRRQYLYIRQESLQKKSVRDFLRYFHQSAQNLKQLPGFIPLKKEEYDTWLPLLEEVTQK